jgi:hypothetical protein
VPPSLSKIAKDYRRSAINRFDEAVLLFEAGKCTGAMYLSGYAVECMLKVMVLSTVTFALQPEFAKRSLQGRAGHDFEALRSLYRKRSGAGFPSGVAKRFAMVSTWSTDLRYDPREAKVIEAEPFLGAVKEIIAWADERV